MNHPRVKVAVLWRPSPTESPQWHLVSCMKVKAAKRGFRKLPFAVYRRWDFVFIVHIPTGLNCGVGRTMQEAWNMVYRAAEGMTVNEYVNLLEHALTAGNYPPKPNL